MLLEESKTKQDEVLLVQEPDKGIGYQMIAALQRLGVKCMVQGKSADYKLHPLQTLGSDDSSNAPSALLLSPTQLLREQRKLTATELTDLYAQAATPATSMHVVLVLPYTTSAEQIEALLNARDAITVLLSPRPIGFRDGDFFSDIVDALRNQKGVQWEHLKHHTPFEGVFISDLCGFLISVFWNPLFYKKTLIAPSTQMHPMQIIDKLETELEFTANLWERIRSSLSAYKQISATPIPLTEALLLQNVPSARRLLEVLPTTTTPTLVWTKKMAAYLERNPELDLHFPPARTP